MKNYIYTIVICLQVISIISMLFFALALLFANGSGHNIPAKTSIFLGTMAIFSFIVLCILRVWKENIKGK